MIDKAVKVVNRSKFPLNQTMKIIEDSSNKMYCLTLGNKVEQMRWFRMWSLDGEFVNGPGV